MFQANSDGVTFAVMPEGDDWLLRPLAHGLMKYESLKDGSVYIEDIARMNDLLDVKFENSRRLEAARETK